MAKSNRTQNNVANGLPLLLFFFVVQGNDTEMITLWYVIQLVQRRYGKASNFCNLKVVVRSFTIKLQLHVSSGADFYLALGGGGGGGIICSFTPTFPISNIGGDEARAQFSSRKQIK